MMNETPEPVRQKVQLNRLIGRIEALEKGPTLICFGGIHGNEMAGVKALQQIFEELDSNAFKVQGSIYGIRGNIPAQLLGNRFVNQDLNRLWTAPSIHRILDKNKDKLKEEERQLLEIYQLVDTLLKTARPPFYFIDIHTTSSKTVPFITINDALINRRFSQLFSVPIILGIEEYISGALLSHMNAEGYLSLGFESGQHEERSAVDNAISFLWLAMVFTGLLQENELPAFSDHVGRLRHSAQGFDSFFEVVYRRVLTENDEFRMHKGFENFQEVRKGTALGILNGSEIKGEMDSMLFMPLYQKQGEDAYFLMRRIPRWALRLSVILRKIRFDSFLALLPGISWSSKEKKYLLVNLKVARFFTKPFFHLLGYRNRVQDQNHLVMNNRERTAKNKMYRNEWWYKRR